MINKQRVRWALTRNRANAKDFKTIVILEALKEERTLNELATREDLHPSSHKHFLHTYRPPLFIPGRLFYGQNVHKNFFVATKTYAIQNKLQGSL
jgi:hypothetical protein